MRSGRPTRRACRPPENIASERNAVSIGAARLPASATAKKFMNERLA
jgi:hypothetical protein